MDLKKVIKYANLIFAYDVQITGAVLHRDFFKLVCFELVKLDLKQLTHVDLARRLRPAVWMIFFFACVGCDESRFSWNYLIGIEFLGDVN
jgi:hypothetical protein